MSSTNSRPRAKVPLSVQLSFGVGVSAAIFKGLFARANKKRSFKRAMHDSALKEATIRASRLDVSVAQAMLGYSTTDTYGAWAKTKKLTVTSDDIGEGGYIHWIGERNFDSVILYFHGGGFVYPALPGLLNTLHGLKADLKGTKDVGIALLEYSLAPQAPFPTQLSQAIAAINFLISKGASPGNIVFGGDSAGANLVTQVLSHFLHPVPDIIAPPKLSEPFRGALLISPWVSYSDDFESFKKNADLDILYPAKYNWFSEKVAAGVTPETRNNFEAYAAPSEWWTGADKIIPNILVTGGEVECLLDMVTGLAKNLEPHVTTLKTVIEENGVHEEIIFAFDAGEGRSGNGYTEVISWLKSTFA